MKIRALCSKMKNAFFLQFSNRDLKIGHFFMSIFEKSIEELKQKNMQFIIEKPYLVFIR